MKSIRTEGLNHQNSNNCFFLFLLPGDRTLCWVTRNPFQSHVWPRQPQAVQPHEWHGSHVVEQSRAPVAHGAEVRLQDSDHNVARLRRDQPHSHALLAIQPWRHVPGAPGEHDQVAAGRRKCRTLNIRRVAICLLEKVYFLQLSLTFSPF